ncbi:uncharacterized protein LOC106177169 [Lingula anatina]|uniref:Uncharacterized protein LOC106177169 n=1 Tax=Lingula anatina TaxID=7574 RepID=A0A2R2MIX7_LINAN|nr:uncharacterized protein LOC106177169 [Lingula anatina]|eukprot:XP_023930175.1 uncharacterized protein LOC106177169 [Lingula anatina]
MTFANQSLEQLNDITSKDGPEAPPRKKEDHGTIRKKLQDAGVLKVLEDEGLVPLIEFTDGSGISGQYVARLLPDANYGQSVIEELEQDVKLKLDTRFCTDDYSLSGIGRWGLDHLDDVPSNSKFHCWGDGNGIDVYVVDTGINPNHEDFTGRVTIGWPTSTSVDACGHGTHVAGIIAGTNSGVAKRAKIISVKASFSNYGSCVDLHAPGVDIGSADYQRNSGYVKMSGTSMAAPFVTGAVAALLQVHRDGGDFSLPCPPVIYTAKKVISLAKDGWPTSTSVDDCGHGTHVAGIIAGTNSGVAKRAKIISVKSLNDAVDDLLAAGIPVIVSAGNYNEDACNYSPASATGALTVGAYDVYYGKASFSNYGSCVDLHAPGVDIGSADYQKNSGYVKMSGTSMAAPFVTGAVAALLQVLRDGGDINSPCPPAVNSANHYIKAMAKDGKLSGVNEANKVLYTPCL